MAVALQLLQNPEDLRPSWIFPPELRDPQPTSEPRPLPSLPLSSVTPSFHSSVLIRLLFFSLSLSESERSRRFQRRNFKSCGGGGGPVRKRSTRQVSPPPHLHLPTSSPTG